MTWRISEFIPEKHFGFCCCDDPTATEVKAFFHARDFIRIAPGEVGPILGEQVLVSEVQNQDKGPCARRVQRITSPTLQRGTVISYNPNKMWGFLCGENKKEFYFHKREIIGSWVPLPGSPVIFYDGNVSGKGRACWVCIRRKDV